MQGYGRVLKVPGAFELSELYVQQMHNQIVLYVVEMFTPLK